ncbi:DnaJ domain-containing protein [Tumidithrix elongata RA019]|uniref:DnaJ domain-containing protein n=1 Tax=Tumidithrix elongata BACA0141 TaxID=2716417 RepID=A0AAW9PTQ2_9CYAN|nr:DnaJ domain-containing protein [Tumidithrix elongata RA019]
MGKPEIFKISRGLASYKLPDYYAILGLAMTTDAAHVRKKFLQLAKVLHPDVFGRTAEEKELATNYLSKMVSPAYQTLHNDRERGEYLATLRLFAQGQKQKAEQPTLKSELAQKLYKYPHKTTYTKFVEEISPLQYKSLDKILQYTEDLSELNLVYLLTQQSLVFSSASSTPSATSASPPSTTASSTSTAEVSRPPAQSPATRSIQMAELFISKKQWADALKELKAAEKLDPNNAKVFGMQGLVYMNQNVAMMAKTNFQKALKIDPKEPISLKYINQLNSSTSTQAAKPPAKQPDKKSGGGLFGWGKK